ncbi:hypothetical protein [Herbiconiux sp. A18JL235]|uniref:Major facilitator superfamily (MFS) profile domain-containing protein n=1 Tax=Herbiconiux sp. A18JL235 TaxID=3152363 RepID=A0AB39BJB6_9MICO
MGVVEGRTDACGDDHGRVAGIGGPDDNGHGAALPHLKATLFAALAVGVVSAAGFAIELIRRTPADERGFIAFGILAAAMVALVFGGAALVGGVIAWAITSARPTSRVRRALLGAILTVAPVAVLGGVWDLTSHTAPWLTVLAAAIAAAVASVTTALLVGRRPSGS